LLEAIRSTWALFLGLTLLMVGNGLLLTVVGLRAPLEGFATPVVGVVMSGYYVGFLAGALLTPVMVRRVGHIRVFAALACCASTAALLHTLVIDPVSWTLMRVATGLCASGLYVVAESWLNDSATNRTRGQILSAYMIVLLGGLAAGQALMTLADPAGFQAFVLASVLVSLAVIPILITRTQAPPYAAPRPVGPRRLYRISPLGVVGAWLTGVAHGAFYGMGAVYATAVGLSAAEAALFLSVMTIGGMVLQWPIGRVSDRFDRRTVIIAVALAAAATALAAGHVGGASAAAQLALAALFGGLTLPLYSLFIAHTNDHLAPSEIVPASGSLVLVGGTGAILGPLGVSAAMSLVGPAAFFWWLAAVHAAMVAFALYRMARRSSPPLGEQARTVSLAGAGASATALALEEGQTSSEEGARTE
jgi:MFS family permease